MDFELSGPSNENKFYCNLALICIEKSSENQVWKLHQLGRGRFSISCQRLGGLNNPASKYLFLGTFNPGVNIKLTYRQNFFSRLAEVSILLTAGLLALASLWGIWEWSKDTSQNPYFLYGLFTGGAFWFSVCAERSLRRSRFAEARDFLEQALEG